MIVDKLEKRSGFLYMAKEKFKSMDMFGQEPKLTWNGEEQYKTLWGATVSTVITFLLLAFFMYRILFLVWRMDPAFAMATLRLTPEDDTYYQP